MRAFFVLSLTCCVVAVAAPTTTDVEVVVPLTSRLAEGPGPARPVTVRVEVTPSPVPLPSPTPQAPRSAPPTPDPTARPVSQAPAAEPTPTQTPQPTPTPTATPAATAPPSGSPTPRTYTRAEVMDGIRRAWGGDAEKAIKVADCESGLNPRATSANGQNLGLWQFRLETWRTHGGSGDPRDHSPQAQTQVAWRLFSQRGWAPWPGCA